MPKCHRLRHRRSVDGYVYVAATPSMRARHVYKIGCTINLQQRRATLSCSHDEDYEIIRAIYCSRKLAAEKAMHMYLRAYHTVREFFHIPNDVFEHEINTGFRYLSNFERTYSDPTLESDDVDDQLSQAPRIGGLERFSRYWITTFDSK